MPSYHRLPYDLTFPSLRYGRKVTPFDLTMLLYQGGAACNRRCVRSMISEGTLGRLLVERVEVVKKLHETISDKLTLGSAFLSISNDVRGLRYFVSWVDQSDYKLNMDALELLYLQWTDSLVHRTQTKDMQPNYAYKLGCVVGKILSIVLNRPAALISATRLQLPKRRKSAIGPQAEKQNLEHTFSFGRMLLDITDALLATVVMAGPLPVRVPLRSGSCMVCWSGFTDPFSRYDSPTAIQKSTTLKRLAAFESDQTLRTRYPLVNLRIEAELLMFIGQTGMNVSQAHRLRMGHFFYASHLDGYQVKEWKQRRGGEVLFEIFRDYKPHFERYLEWRREIFKDTDLLFPFCGLRGRSEDKPTHFRLRDICAKMGLPFVTPRELRNTRVNWLLRESGDPELTAAMAQHSKETLLRVYERPSQQRAMGEVMRFWAANDPSQGSFSSVAPGQCDGIPIPVSSAPSDAPTPDCLRPSGCLWCEHHRDVDNQAHVWSLASFAHLKLIELSGWRHTGGPESVHPAQLVVDRLSEKLRWFYDSNAQRRSWVDEAQARIEEGRYHPDWQRQITVLEGSYASGT